MTREEYEFVTTTQIIGEFNTDPSKEFPGTTGRDDRQKEVKM